MTDTLEHVSPHHPFLSRAQYEGRRSNDKGEEWLNQGRSKPTVFSNSEYVLMLTSMLASLKQNSTDLHPCLGAQFCARVLCDDCVLGSPQQMLGSEIMLPQNNSDPEAYRRIINTEINRLALGRTL